MVWRLCVIVLVAGCRQIFGIGDPQLGDLVDGRKADAPRDGVTDAAPAFCGADTDLVACFEFEGSVVDESPNHLETTSANVAFAIGVEGQAAAMTASSRIDIADSPLLDVLEVTSEAWINLSALPTAGTRAGVLDCDTQYGMFVKPTSITCTGGGMLDVAITLPTNQWVHVACTTGTELAVYVDGTKIGALPLTGIVQTSGTTGLSIGADNPPGAGSPLLGRIDQLRVFSRARTPQEICADAGRVGC